MANLRKVMNSFRYAFQGWRTGFRTQLNFRIQLGLAVAAVALGVFFRLDVREWLWLLLSIVLVLAAELFNSAIELLVDLVSPEWNDKAGKVKDMAAGAVTIIAIGAAVIGLIIFVPKFMALF